MAYGLLDWFKADVGEAAIYAIVGFLFVFIGIALLVLIFMGLGKVMATVTEKRTAKVRSAMEAKMLPAAEKTAGEDGISPEVIAAITAAIAMYYEQEGGRCDFIVKRIKRV